MILFVYLDSTSYFDALPLICIAYAVFKKWYYVIESNK